MRGLAGLVVVGLALGVAARGEDRAVRVELLADATGIAPGGSCLLAARLEIAEGWHVYWKNPGDSGLATAFQPAGPDGFDMGDVQYPGPDRFELAGDVVAFGWERSTALFVRVTAPKTAAVGSRATFTARVSWLACRETCVPGSTDLALELPVVADPKAANADRLEPFRRRLPKPQAELKGLSTEWRGEPATPTLTLALEDAVAVELFPDRAAYATLVRRSTERGRATYGFAFDGREKPPELTGVIAANRKGEWTYTDVRFAWPKSPGF